MEKITLIGAGLAGSLLAIILRKKGYIVQVFERRPDIRRADISAGRSINLALSVRGIDALEHVGLQNVILQEAIPMYGRMMHNVQGELTFQQYGKNDTEYINSVSRGGLNKALLIEAENHGVELVFNKRCEGFDFATKTLQLVDETTGEYTQVPYSTVIGTDGSASAMRMEMQKVGRFNLSQEYLETGYKELTIPAATDGGFAIEKNALHIWPRGSFMMIALPNTDGSFTCTLFLPWEGNNGFNALQTKPELEAFFTKNFPDALPIMPNYVDTFFENPTGSLMTIKCFPWHVDGSALLLGDAAHAIVPFFGQGMNCAFEDCVELSNIIDAHSGNWTKVFEEYQYKRKVNTDAIADLACENLIEMRDRVADPKFLMMKQLEHILEKRFEPAFLSKYAMVTFNKIPYSVAMERGRVQEGILYDLCSNANSIDDIDPDAAFAQISKALL